ncbi:MAG: PHP domain-containing protein, partial [Thermoanaerobaculia bacterium]|nr:PHP domain-containing protein [Thermoanaerobaculia bacterium]
MSFGGADLHFHSTFSDGVETPGALVARAVAAGLSVAALTDHDAVHGVPAF